jgi:hypothetical protein
MIESIKAYDEDDWKLIENDPENIAFQNSQNILSRKNAKMITNEFIKPIETVNLNQNEKKISQEGNLQFEPIANSVVLFLKDDSSFPESIYKYDFEYTLPRWVFLLAFLILSGLILILILAFIDYFKLDFN